MFKVPLYLLSVVGLVGTSAVIGQRWRLDGASQESSKKTTGSVTFEEYKANAEAEALKIFAERERDGLMESSAIVQDGKVERQKLSLEGDAIRVKLEQAAELATQKLYLDPMMGYQVAMTNLRAKLAGNLAGEDRENTQIVLQVLMNAQRETREAMNRLRVEAAQKVSRDYVWSQTRGGCPPPTSAASTVWGGAR